ncbi:MAG: hypothetical protein NTU79_22305 [Planctomycetota bacterium]|nr:hypothetical protein [Planctomycetota bacterium]
MNHVSHADTNITRTDLGPARWGTLSTTIASTTNNMPFVTNWMCAPSASRGYGVKGGAKPKTSPAKMRAKP